MNSRLDSTGLFIRQFAGHVQLLTELLMTNCDSTANSSLIEKCIISTKMLANSTSLMGLSHWDELLSEYESLLLEYRDADLRWDDRIAQVTSELIEKEELLSKSTDEGEWNPDTLVTPDEVKALMTEVSILLSIAHSGCTGTEAAETEEACAEAESPADSAGADECVPEPREAPAETEEACAEAESPADTAGADECVPVPRETPAETEPSRDAVDADAGDAEEDRSGGGEIEIEIEKPEFIGGLISQLDISTGRLLQEWKAWKSRSKDPTSFDIQKIKQDSYLIHFYALSLVEIAEMKNEALDKPTVSTLEHLRVVLDLYAALLSERDGCRVDIGFLGEENTLDVALLFSAAKILKSMINDISRRSSENYLRIEIEVENRNGALYWCLRDNGNNFINDSRLDRDDFLAFYPGLREVKQQLEQFHGVLWVEPDEDHDRRFAFTMPLYANSQAFTVWNHENVKFCMPSLQVCATFSSGDAEIYRDARGEYVTVDEAQIPLLKLSMLCPEAPETGGTIVVAGSLEKRIAFYAPDEGDAEEGRWQKVPVPSWNGISCGMADFADERVPVIESSKIVQQYLGTLGSTYTERMSGSIVENEPAAAQDEPDENEQHEEVPDEGGVDILVVERSEAVRDALATILSPTNLSVRMYDDLSAIGQFLTANDPAVIISDLREPSRAAQSLIDSIHTAGKEIPVILSTAQAEDKAAALATAIGAAGYFLKPLDSKKVMRTLRKFVPIDENCGVRE